MRDHFEGSDQQVMAMFAEMQNVNDRVAAVSCTAFLDDSIGAALAAHFVRLGKQWQDLIFSGPTAPLSTFAGKIRVGYALGLYGSATCKDLDIMRSIRNDFAHTAGPLSFTDTVIADKCSRLSTPRRIIKGELGGLSPQPNTDQNRYMLGRRNTLRGG
jgi:DNA-binding MltR family transcriptional regulator